MRPLMDLLESRNGNLQHNAAFALYGLADNEDNIADIVRDGEPACAVLYCVRHISYWRYQHEVHMAAHTITRVGLDQASGVIYQAKWGSDPAVLFATGGVQRLQRADLIVQASKDCVQKTIKRLEEKITGAFFGQITCLRFTGTAT